MNTEETGSQFNVENVKQSYDEKKAREERDGEWVVYYVYRPLSFQITPFFLRLGLTPSNVTAVSLALTLCLPFIALWFPAPYLFVGLVAFIFSVFDCVDGNIARMTGRVSQSGHYFDFLTDIIHRVSFYFAIGIMINQGSTTPGIFENSATEYLLIAAMLAIIARMCRVYVRSEFQTNKTFSSSNDSSSNEKASSKEAASGNGNSSSWLDKTLFPFMSGLDWALPIVVVILGYFDLLHWILIWLLLYSSLDFLYTQYSNFSKLN